MNRFRAQVSSALEAMAIGPSGSAAWCGRRLARTPRGLPAAAARAYLAAVAEQVLYEAFYCPGAPIPWSPDARASEPGRDPAFVDALAAANAGSGCWAGGWRVDGRRGDALVLGRNGLQITAEPSQVRIDGTGAQIRLPKELRFASPGHYIALGDLDLPAASEYPLLRVYFHVVPSEAARLVGLVTSSLNDLGVAFRLKVVDAPEQFGRCDAAVLYVRASDFDALRPVLRGLAARVGMRERTPALTKPIRPGIGLAEDPASGESFGMHRCGLLARGIVEAQVAGATRPGDRLAVVERHFAAHGIDLEAPYLRPASPDAYAL